VPVGNYDVDGAGWRRARRGRLLQQPDGLRRHLHGEHLDWLRARVELVLVVGQGAWEDTRPARCPSTRAIRGVLSDKGIRHEVDLWGYDVPHDWPSWRRQLAHHLPRFC
jgi:esterase/lipase superfamily enzyme